MVTVELQNYVVSVLKNNNIEDAEFEAKQILMKILGISALDLMFKKNDLIADEVFLEIKRLVEERISGYPLQYILGEWEFYGIPIKVGEGVLIPRPETELLTELAIDFIKDKSNAVGIDLCSGSGCIAISVVKNTNCSMYAIELSEKAFFYLKENLVLNNCEKNVTIINGNIFDESVMDDIPELDFILSNPPYLSQSDMDDLQLEVRKEPEMALFGGENGYEFYYRIFELWRTKLKSGGLFAVEIGLDQETEVSIFMQKAGISPRYIRDLNGIIRVVYGIKR